jgi:hypothetical protein
MKAATVKREFQEIIKTYYPKFCKMILDHCEEGYAVETFAGAYNISAGLIVPWMNMYPEFKEAVVTGNSKTIYYWESQLKNAICDDNKPLIDIAVKMLDRYGKSVFDNGIRESIYNGLKKETENKQATPDADIVKELENKLKVQL